MLWLHCRFNSVIRRSSRTVIKALYSLHAYLKTIAQLNSTKFDLIKVII